MVPAAPWLACRAPVNERPEHAVIPAVVEVVDDVDVEVLDDVLVVVVAEVFFAT